MIASPTVSVVVPVRNDGSNFRRCLEAIHACDPPPHEVIVIDDSSTDDTPRIAREWGARVLSSGRVGGGPARARNLGAQAATGDVVLFVDADVALHPDAIERVTRNFENDPELAACFGSYDDEPGAPNFLSQYKNLFHHYVHQSARADASTFWAGCGAIRREVFLAVGGFSAEYDRPAIEDIELGYRLKAAGHRLRLDKQLQGKHLKQWTLRALLRSDIFDRGVPWTELILRDGVLVNDLNLQTHNRASVVVVYVLLLTLLAGLAWPAAWVASVMLAIGLLALNRAVYRFFAAHRGRLFALRVIPMHWLYYTYNGVSFVIGLGRHLFSSHGTGDLRDMPPATAGVVSERRHIQTWLIFALSLVITLAPLQWVIDTWVPQGDEPHYLLAAHSLAVDGDLDLENNYAQGDFKRFYPAPTIDPHVRIGVDGRSYLVHDVGLPILIAPAYALGGRAGVAIFLALVGALVAVNMYLLAFEVTGRRAAACATWLAFALAPLPALYGYLVHPELAGALAVIWSVRQIRNSYSVLRIPYSVSVSLAIGLLPWSSARFLPIAAFLAVWAAWRWRGDRRRLAIAISIPLLSLIGYFAASAWMSSGSGAIDFNTERVTRGLEGFSVERVARGLAGWWLDQQRGVLIFAPILVAALIGLPRLWRRLGWAGLALLTPLLIAYGSVAIWGGFWVNWELSARYLVVGLPLLAAPLALALAEIRSPIFRGLTAALLAISAVNTVLILSAPGYVAYRESPVLIYDRGTPLDLWSMLPALGGGGRVDPDPNAPSTALVVADGDRSAWHAPSGSGGVVMQSSGLKDLSAGSYALRFEARARGAASPDAPLLSVDVFSGEGIFLLHHVLAASDFPADGLYSSFALPFQSPFYNKWSYPVYAQITTSGLAEVWVSALTVEVEAGRMWGVIGVWAALIGLAIVVFNPHPIPPPFVAGQTTPAPALPRYDRGRGKLVAFVAHGFVLARSYKLNFLARYLTTFVTVVFYIFLAEMFRRAGVTVAPGVDYFSFLLIGGAFSKYVEIGMGTLSHTLRDEMLTGTLEPLLATATPATLALLGPSLFAVAEGTLLVLAQLLMGAASGADFSRANWPAAIVVAVLMVGCLMCWGAIAAAFTLRYKRQDPVLSIVGAISYVFSGVFFPVSMLPPAMQVISYALPFTYGLQGLRGALLNGKGLIDVLPDVATLLLFTAVLLPIALWSIRAATRHLKVSGALGHY